jgi:16S rRNA (guanine(966)-N(2))-methyltransferase RsmD
MAFFNIAGARIEGARFLDLFAGSGVFSFEAVSRGAASAVAIEQDRKAVETIVNLAEEWHVPVTPIGADVFAGIPRLAAKVADGAKFDVVYADPPYSFGRYDELLEMIDRHVPLAGGALVAIEHQRRSNPFTIECKRLKTIRRAEYGEIWITLFEVA